MKRAPRRLRDERGSVLITGLLLTLALLMVIGAAVDLGHAFIVRRDLTSLADDAIARARTQTGVTLQLQLDGTFARGAVLQAQTSAQIGLASLPFIGQLGTITVHGSAAAPVDTYRSLIGDSSP